MPKNISDRKEQSIPQLPVAEGGGDLATIDAIRTETIFSRLPIHQLSKRANTDIRLIRRDTSRGQITLRWEVSYNNRYGAARQLAYKADKLIVDRHIDNSPTPLPRYVRLGSLRDIAQQLGLGTNTAKAKNALHQNASTYIVVKLSYRAKDGTTHFVEDSNTRYRLIIRGQQFPDGTTAETAYIAFNDPFLQVINNSARRPLDYDYLKLLPPAAQRFYELLSFSMFPTLKYGHSEAKLRYSQFCSEAPQTRYLTREQMQKQMYKVHRPHTSSGYLAKVRYEKSSDEQGNADWIIFYTPGPKARAEYQAFHGKRLRAASKPTSVAPTKSLAAAAGQGSAPPKSPAQPAVNKTLLSALSECGISNAAHILAQAKDDEHVADCLDYCDTQDNIGPGLLVDLIRKKRDLPATFETRAQRRQSQAAEQKRQQLHLERERLKSAYDDYRSREVDRYISEQLPPKDYQELLETMKSVLSSQYSFWREPNKTEGLERLAALGARKEIGEKRLSLITFEEFSRQHPEASQKPAGEPRNPAQDATLQATPERAQEPKFGPTEPTQ